MTLANVLDAPYEFAFEPYDRAFKRPLQTHHGEWSVRQGIFVYLRDDRGVVGVGEISPLSWFGTESIEEAIAFCSSLSRTLYLSEILAIPAHYPAVQFGFGTALEALANPPLMETLFPSQICGLLPSGDTAQNAWKRLWSQGHRTFKWKIGVLDIEIELQLFQALITTLPPSAKLRLDANGGLDVDQAQRWICACEAVQQNAQAPRIEYIEQPLAPADWQNLLALACDSQFAIALDESVATVDDLLWWHEQGWPGIYVVKPAIMGFPQTLRDVCRTIPNPKIFSSVFEADIGRQKAQRLAQELMTPDFALGFGVDHWLAESPNVSINSSTFS